MMKRDFDIVVVGAGHAGIEAALMAARRGHSVLLATTNLARIGYMSCNPAIGGLAKGHMVREVDALGGEMGRATDASCIQFKRLNASKGPAVRGSRAQCDKDVYSQYMTRAVNRQPGLRVLECEVKELIFDGSKVRGVKFHDGATVDCSCVVITAGTFMNGVMHVGLQKSAGGRVGDSATSGLSEQLKALGFRVQRLKTGTPARLERESIDFGVLDAQRGDEKFYPFSHRSDRNLILPQVECHLSYTNERTHEIIRANLHKSPMFCGVIEGVGPRYCPSIEDKVVRFANKDRHQTFLEPEGLSTNLIYLQGISTSLPAEVQLEFLRTIRGLENVKVVRYGYAVEYDFVDPTQIQKSLMTQGFEGLFLAGQVNGTSGYEEAAAQGCLAGINASMYIEDRQPLILGRDEAYLGVLVDDLVTKGTEEPYRMFTARAEHRLVLREDNSLDRLIAKGREYGSIESESFAVFEEARENRYLLKEKIETTMIYPTDDTNLVLEKLGTSRLINPQSLAQLLRRPEIGWTELAALGLESVPEPEIAEALEIDVKYSGYVERQLELIRQASRLENMSLDPDMRYSNVRGLSHEEVEKLTKIRPRSLGQASRISGVNPSAIQAILVFLKGRGKVRDLEGQRAQLEN